MVTDRIHKFNQVTLAIDKELEELFEKEINLFLTPMEISENAVVGAIWDASGGPNMCPLCSSLHGQFFPVESGEFGRLEPGGVHQNCQCLWRYVTGRQRGVQQLIEGYRPVDPELLKKWTSKIFTKEEIREMMRNVSEHTVLRERMAEFGDKYGGAKIERGVALDVNGNQILSKVGTKNSIRFSLEESSRISNRNLIFIHNHPSGSSFSIDDILSAKYHNFKEISVVGSKYRYTISPKTPGKWPSTPDLKVAHKAQVDKYEDWFYQNIPPLTRQEAWNEVTHKVWRNLAKDFNLIYERILI